MDSLEKDCFRLKVFVQLFSRTYVSTLELRKAKMLVVEARIKVDYIEIDNGLLL